MADQDTGTEPQGTDQNQTGADVPATDSTNDQGSASQDKDVVTLSQKDYDNLIAQRDQNHENARTLEERVAAMEQQQQKGSKLDAWYEQNKDNYPDVERADLEVVDNPDDADRIARHIQDKADRVRQAEIEKAQQPPQQTLTQEEFAEQEKELLQSEDPDAFEKWAAAQMQVE